MRWSTTTRKLSKTTSQAVASLTRTQYKPKPTNPMLLQKATSCTPSAYTNTRHVHNTCFAETLGLKTVDLNEYWTGLEWTGMDWTGYWTGQPLVKSRSFRVLHRPLHMHPSRLGLCHASGRLWIRVKRQGLLPATQFSYTKPCDPNPNPNPNPNTKVFRLLRMLRILKLMRIIRASRIIRRWQASSFNGGRRAQGRGGGGR